MNTISLFNPKTLIVGLALALLGALGIAGPAAALPQDCATNSIIKCGTQTKEEFRTKYNSSDELKKLYAHPMFNKANGAGLQGGDIDRFVSEAKLGKLYKNGNLILDSGEKVIENAWSMGREKRGNPYRYPITVNTGANNNTYYYGTTQVSFGQNTDFLPVWVLFNEDGEVEFSVITACGNISWGDNRKPEYKCEALNEHKVNGKENTRKFNTTVHKNDLAKVSKVEYFIDGTFWTSTDAAEKMTEEYTFTKTSKVTVKVHFKLVGDKPKEVTGPKCEKTIEVKKEEPKPEFSCKELNKYLVSGNRKYKFVATGYFKNTELVSATFDYGDGSAKDTIASIVIVNPTTATITSKDHEYAKDKTGKITVTADLKFKVGNDFKNHKCTTTFELSELTCADTPDKPECNPPKYCKPEQQIPEGDARCKEILPKEIVKTGPAEIAASALGLGSIAGAGMYYRASRRNVIDKIFKR